MLTLQWRATGFTLLAIVIQFHLFEVSEGGYYFYIRHDSTTGYCTYKGYVPGGVLPNIKPIASPVAKAQKDALTQILSFGAKGSAVAMHSTNAAKAFLNVFAKTAPKIASSLGVFGAALGVLTEFTKPTAQDLLNEVNKALKKLTDEVNHRLTQMKDYVDTQVIKVEKNLMDSEYKRLFLLWKKCLEEHKKSEADEAQRDANRFIGASQPKFMTLSDKISVYDPDNWQQGGPSHHDVKRIEAGLLGFRDFATLHLMVLKGLVDTYAEGKDADSVVYYHRYLGELKTAGMLYYKYANWAYKWILVRQVKENRIAKVTCPKRKEIWEGWFVKAHTADTSTCEVHCTRMMHDSKCSYKQTVRVDGKKPDKYVKTYINWAHPKQWQFALDSNCRSKLKKICTTYLNKMEEAIKEYYTQNLLNVAAVWKKSSEDTDGKMKALGIVSGDESMVISERYPDQERYDETVEDEDEDDEEREQERDEKQMESDGYSENFEERLRKATLEAKMLEF